MTEKNNNHTARVSKKIGATTSRVWDALTSPEEIARYMFGARVETDWQPGSEIVWKGEWDGQEFLDTGTVLSVEPQRLLRYSHVSSGGTDELTDNYHIITVELSPDGNTTVIDLTQDNNRSPQAQHEAEKNWDQMLEGLRDLVES